MNDLNTSLMNTNTTHITTIRKNSNRDMNGNCIDSVVCMVTTENKPFINSKKVEAEGLPAHYEYKTVLRAGETIGIKYNIINVHETMCTAWPNGGGHSWLRIGNTKL